MKRFSSKKFMINSWTCEQYRTFSDSLFFQVSQDGSWNNLNPFHKSKNWNKQSPGGATNETSLNLSKVG